MSDIVAEIATGAQAQATGIEQVTRAVTEMDKVTQQNAASAEESSSAASELSGQAEELAAMVAAFQLSAQARTQATVAPQKARSLSLQSPSFGPRTPPRARQRAAPAVPLVVRSDDAGSTPARMRRLPGGAPVKARDASSMDEASEVKDF